MAIGHVESRPARRDARLEAKRVPLQAESENCFEGDAVQPARRAGVPCPAAAPRMRWRAVHIGADHVRLNLVVRYFRGRRGVIDGIDQVPEFEREVSATL